MLGLGERREHGGHVLHQSLDLFGCLLTLRFGRARGLLAVCPESAAIPTVGPCSRGRDQLRVVEDQRRLGHLSEHLYHPEPRADLDAGVLRQLYTPGYHLDQVNLDARPDKLAQGHPEHPPGGSDNLLQVFGEAGPHGRTVADPFGFLCLT